MTVSALRCVWIGLFIFLPLDLWANDETDYEAAATAVETAPTLDGDILNDPVWQSILPLTEFWQTAPDEGQPASERTAVRIAYSNTTLYIGVICYDTEPGRIVISDSRRDASLDETDSFRFIFDTYKDGQNGFVFGTNPAGIEYDAQVTKEGQGGFGRGRQQSGAIGGFNLNWDGSWDVFTQVGDFGWSAEFAIPFRTLRFPRSDVQTWGVNFQRNIRKRNETAFWVKLPRQYDLNRVSMAGTLSGLQVPDPRNLKVVPYVLGQLSRDFTDATMTEAERMGDFGMDVKYSLTPSLTLDLTYNTDFAQVEVDEQQVNLDRFNLFFPEKRPFFLENAGLFAVGEPGEVDLFFSRRIGIGPNGVAVPIVGGARLTGSIGGFNVGLLNMQTESVENITQANNFTTARFKRELPNRSSVGVLFTNRQGTGNLAPNNDYNRLIAADGQWGIGEHGQVRAFLARTFSPQATAAQHGLNVEADYNSEKWFLRAGYTEVAEDFNPEMGFLSRQAYRKILLLALNRYRPQDMFGLLELRPHISYRAYWDLSGFHETGFLHVDNHWEWESGFEVHTGVNFTKEGVKVPFNISNGVTVPTGTYDHAEAQIVLITDASKAVSLNGRYIIGGFFGGDRRSFSNTLTVRAGETFNTSVSFRYDDINLPGGDFTINLIQGRLSYSFTPRLYLQGLVQYNESADTWGMNMRLGWLQAANTGLFVVYNQSNDIDGIPLSTLNRSFIIKYSYLIDVFK